MRFAPHRGRVSLPAISRASATNYARVLKSRRRRRRADLLDRQMNSEKAAKMTTSAPRISDRKSVRVWFAWGAVVGNEDNETEGLVGGVARTTAAGVRV